MPCRVHRLHPTLLAPLFAVLAVLLGLAGSASGAFDYAATKPHYGNFWDYPEQAQSDASPQSLEALGENGVGAYDYPLDVPVYVRQNPWSKFDPKGLEEKEIGQGRSCTMDTHNGKNVYAWIENKQVVVSNSKGVITNLGYGQSPVLKALDDQKVLCVWENDKQMKAGIVDL